MTFLVHIEADGQLTLGLVLAFGMRVFHAHPLDQITQTDLQEPKQSPDEIFGTHKGLPADD